MHIRKKYNFQGTRQPGFYPPRATVLDCANGYQKETQEEVDSEESFPREAHGEEANPEEDEEANAEENENS